MKQSFVALSLAALLLSGCERGCSSVKKITAVDDVKSADMGDIEKRTAKLSGDLVQEAFADKDVKAKQDAVWAKVFQEPETAKALQEVGAATIADPTVKARFDSVIKDVMEDPTVVAKLKEIAASASNQADAQAKIEKHVGSAMESPTVSHAIDHGVETLVAAPEVEARLGQIFGAADTADIVRAALKDPELASLSKEVERRVLSVAADGKVDSYYAEWTKAAHDDPAMSAAAREFAVEAVSGLATSTDLKDTIKGGLESARTRTILATATADLLADPEIAAGIKEFFRALFADADASVLAEKTDALFANPKLKKRLQAAIVELLSSKLGAARLEKAVLSGMRTPEANKKLTLFLIRLMKLAPKG